MHRTPQKDFWHRYSLDMLLVPLATFLAFAVWAVLGTLFPL